MKVEFLSSLEQMRESLKLKACAPLIIHEVDEPADQVSRRPRPVVRSSEKAHEGEGDGTFANLAASF